MALPSINFTINSFNLGLQGTPGSVAAVVGYAAIGTIDPTQVGALQVCNSISDVNNLLVAGEAAELTAKIISDGGGTVYVVPTSPAIAATSSSITATVLGNVTASYSASCTPYDTYNGIVTIVSGGGVLTGAPTYQFSVDGGNNFSPVIALPVNGTASLSLGGPTGISILFSGVNLTAGDTFKFTTVGPTLNASNVDAGLSALQVSSSLLAPFKFVACVGVSGSGAGSTAGAQSTLASAIDSTVESWQALYAVFTYAMMEAARADTDINQVTSFNSIAADRLQVCAGGEDLISSLTGRTLIQRSVLYSEAGQRQLSQISQASERIKTGALKGVLKLYNDQSLNSVLDGGRFCTARTWRGLSGFFLSSGQMMAQTGGDFEFVQHREVVDVASRVARASLLLQIGDSVAVNPATGTITNNDASRLEDFVTQQLNNVLVGQVSALKVSVDRTNNILQTSTLKVTIIITPLAVIDTIQVTLELGEIPVSPTGG